MAALFLLSGCAAVPDWADPADWFAIDPVPTKVGVAEGQSHNQSTDFPNLASVPNQPPDVLSPEARMAVQATLVADRANAVYSDETLTGSTSIGAPIGAPIGAYAGRTPSGAPPAPRIGSDLTAATRVPPAAAPTQVAQTQVARTEPVPAPVVQPPAAPSQSVPSQTARTSGEPAKSRLPEVQENSPAVVAALPAAAGGQLVAVIYFGHGSSELDGKDHAVLRDVVSLHRQRGGTIRVVGHASSDTGATDPIGHDLTDDEMSLRRANSVAAGLIALGAARDRVRAEARGGKQPIDNAFTIIGEAGNRRAEIFLEN
jgi:outer membrane protein OmpA-like peptidoglycan-associated protein